MCTVLPESSQSWQITPTPLHINTCAHGHMSPHTHSLSTASPAHPILEVHSIDHIDPEVTHWKQLFDWSAGMDAVPRVQPGMWLYLCFQWCWWKQRTWVGIRWILWISSAVKGDIITRLLRHRLLLISHLPGEGQKKDLKVPRFNIAGLGCLHGMTKALIWASRQLEYERWYITEGHKSFSSEKTHSFSNGGGSRVGV